MRVSCTFYFPHLRSPSRCLDDVDDEVRDRAAMYLRMFKECLLADAYVKEGESPDLFGAPTYRVIESVFSLDALESKLVSYVNDPSASVAAFDASSIPKISRAQAAAEAARRFPPGTSPFFPTHPSIQDRAHLKRLVFQPNRRPHPYRSYLPRRPGQHTFNSSRKSPSWRHMARPWEVQSLFN